MVHVIAKIDKASRARLSWIQSFAASFGIVPRPISGHITLAELDGEQDAAIAACVDALAGQGAFTVDFQTVEFCPGKRPLRLWQPGRASWMNCTENWYPARNGRPVSCCCGITW